MSKTPDEIKKGLECCLTHEGCWPCPYDDPATKDCGICMPELLADSLACIKQLEKIVFDQNMVILGNQDVITRQERVRADLQDEIWHLKQQVPKWISVNEQPEPPKDDMYWCYGYWIGSGREQAETAEYSYGEWKIVNNFVLTHWMPLPEPPKEDA